MVQLGKFERYLIEEFFDDYRAGAMTHRTFTRRVAFIMGSMAAASAAMLLVGCTPEEVPRGTDPMPTPYRFDHGHRHCFRGTGTRGEKPAVRSGGRCRADDGDSPVRRRRNRHQRLPRPAGLWCGRPGGPGLPREPRTDPTHPGRGAPVRQSGLRRAGPGPAEQGRGNSQPRFRRRIGCADQRRGGAACCRFCGGV